MVSKHAVDGRKTGWKTYQWKRSNGSSDTSDFVGDLVDLGALVTLHDCAHCLGAVIVLLSTLVGAGLALAVPAGEGTGILLAR